MAMKISERLKVPAAAQGKDTGASTSASALPERIKYGMPDPEKYDLYDLDPLTKRKVTICNLFANHDKTVLEISSLLETSRKLVIDTLIENQLLKDRRQNQRPRTPTPEEIRMR
jgi:hypothetical protein